MRIWLIQCLDYTDPDSKCVANAYGFMNYQDAVDVMNDMYQTELSEAEFDEDDIIFATEEDSSRNMCYFSEFGDGNELLYECTLKELMIE